MPPHNLQAEESLLGAMLLSRDAIAAALEILSADDFYKPAHGHVFEAVANLYGAGEPADPVTVAEELHRAGLLEAIGGSATLVALQAATPATSNAARYARIVEEHALLRKLIGVAGEIAELGYSLPDDVSDAVDRAEALMFDVAQRRVADTMAPLRELLEANLDRLEALYERNEAITGTPTGYADLDEQLAGLQPANLVVIGARPSMGKALALDTPIPTPSGWTTMGALAPGDVVLDDRGTPCRVTYVSPVYAGRPCYAVRFDEGSTLVADADHQWLAYDHRAWRSLRGRRLNAILSPAQPALARDQSRRIVPPRVVTTAQMLAEGVRVQRDGRPNWYLPLAGAIDLPEADLPVDPYALGCWLGDGRTELAAAGYAWWHRPGPEPLHDSTAAVRGPGPLGTLTRELQAAGLLGAARKHIPAAYLRASAKQRLALLQGLMDRDGTVTNGHGTVELCLGDEALLHQAREVVCSLGHKPGPVRRRLIRLADGRTAEAWRFRWSPLDPVFRLERKARRLEATGSRRSSGRPTRRAIVDIRPVASVPVRCITVDSPSHLYLAGESMIPTHNTAFALGMASHAAVQAQRPVLFFSLEMSHMELTQRLLCAEARVDATRMRNGKLVESDWPKISHAVGRLAEAPIYIDDNPNLTILEVRSKARRLKSRVGDIGMIVVDYLQLMTGRERENRQVEVSEMSRGLKILARELGVPVVALSQLSRNLEQRADKRPVLADLRESGCMPASTRLLRADTGQEVSLGELVLSQEQPVVWSLDNRHRVVPARLTRAFPSGIKPVFRLHLATGRQVDATANHPFLTVDGWRRLDELAPGDSVAVPRRVPTPQAPTDGWTDDEIVLLAQLLGGGRIGPDGVTYATADPANKAAVEDAARRAFGIEVTGRQQGRTWRLRLPSPYRLTGERRHPIRNWLEPYGLWGARSGDTFVPEEVHALPDDKLALFLRHLWATRRGRAAAVPYACTSHRLARDVQRALVRLGIRSRVSRARKQGPTDSWHVAVQGAPDQIAFLTRVGGAAGSTARRDLAPSDVVWDEIEEVVPLGAQPTFDASVEGTHNFIADGVVAHNSIEQDADVVMFIYRDEVYNPESPDRGTAEILVAKHRNGPTGRCRLAFLDHYTRFANMARGV